MALIDRGGNAVNNNRYFSIFFVGQGSYTKGFPIDIRFYDISDNLRGEIVTSFNKGVKEIVVLVIGLQITYIYLELKAFGTDMEIEIGQVLFYFKELVHMESDLVFLVMF